MSETTTMRQADLYVQAVTILAAARRRLTAAGHVHATLDRTIVHGLVLDVDEQEEVATLTIEYDLDTCIVRGNVWDATRRTYRQAVYVEAGTAAEIDRAVYRWLQRVAPEAAVLTVEVTTPGEADRLLAGAVLRDAAGGVWESHVEKDCYGEPVVVWSSTRALERLSEDLPLPARVLHLPGTEEER